VRARERDKTKTNNRHHEAHEGETNALRAKTAAGHPEPVEACPELVEGGGRVPVSESRVPPLRLLVVPARCGNEVSRYRGIGEGEKGNTGFLPPIESGAGSARRVRTRRGARE